MTLRKSTTFDYTNRNFHMDFTNLERLPTNTGIALIDRLNREANEQCEALELLFTEIECKEIDNEKSPLSEADKREIRMLLADKDFNKREIQELYDIERWELNKILNYRGRHLGIMGAAAAEGFGTYKDPDETGKCYDDPLNVFDDNGAENDVFEVLIENEDDDGSMVDDFDEADPRYLEILGEIA
tara:strand:+ start:258 stop:815 length:558 start_codon:yes stop_codon:yes gene_type:complete